MRDIMACILLASLEGALWNYSDSHAGTALQKALPVHVRGHLANAATGLEKV